MRFQRLLLKAFGPFHEAAWEFPAEGGDFQLLFGPNEAGKSSTLRAIRDLLYGIPRQSSDNFRHEYKKMLVGAEIQGAEGRHLHFFRRKGELANSLLDANLQPLPPDSLKAFLGNVDQDYFRAMFGLGVEDLHTGGEELLTGGGAIGKALFAASLGGASVGSSIKELRKKMDDLYRPQASSRRIPVLRRELEDHRSATKDAVIAPGEWNRLQATLAEIEADLATCEQERDVLRRDLQWLDRCLASSPTITQYHCKAESLALLAGLPTISNEVVERIREVHASVVRGEAEVERLELAIVHHVNRLEQTRHDHRVVSRAKRIDYFHRELASHLEAVKQGNLLDERLRTKRDALESAVRKLGLADNVEAFETRKPSSPREQIFRQVAGECADARQKYEQEEQRLASLRGNLDATNKGLEGLESQDLSHLRRAVEQSAADKAALGLVRSTGRGIEKLKREIAGLHRRLSGAPGDWEATAQLVLPAVATMQHFDKRFRDLERDARSVRQQLEATEESVAKTEDELNGIQRGGELPTLEELREARAHRERGWRQVLGDWRGWQVDEPFDAAGPLEEAYAEAVQRADHIADQLRIEADAVAHLEEKKQQIKNQQRAMARVQQQLDSIRASEEELDAEWKALWLPTGVPPRTPAEMIEWRKEWEAFGDGLGRLQEADDTIREAMQTLSQSASLLKAALGLPGEVASVLEEIEPLLQCADEQLQEGIERNGRRKQLEEQLIGDRFKVEQAEQQLRQAEEKRDHSQENWRAICREWGYSEKLSPESGLKLLDDELALDKECEEYRELQKQSKASQERRERFEQEVLACGAEYDIRGGSVEVVEGELWALCKAEEKKQQAEEQAEANLERDREALSEKRDEVAKMTRERDDLLQSANIQTCEALESVLCQIESRNQLREDLENLKEQLVALAQKEDWQEFARRVREEDLSTQEARKEKITRAIAEGEERIRALGRRFTEETHKRKLMEETTQVAAERQQQAEFTESSLTELSLEYVRTRLAVHVLETQIESFRRATQGPLMRRGGELFASITLGAFSGLELEYDETDVATIVGCRPGGKTVGVEGMSAGTRDQLYLALRIAALELHMQDHEPMPLILDDLLITFDDQRAAAILKEFQQLSRKTQILLFTHHEHLLEMCRDTLELPESNIHRMHPTPLA